MPPTVESLCKDLARSKLVSADEVRALYPRWVREAGAAADDVEKFSAWLARNQVATEYQIGFIQRGHADQLFLGPYTLIERIGKGRMAGVYKAVHRLGQVVAIKILPPSRAKEPQTLARFRRESRLAVRLNHPAVVRTYQAGTSDNLNYLVMEYMEGETLQDLLQRRGKLPPAEGVRIIYQALLGLQHIFEQGLVHRDLKPGNVMLVPGHGPTTDGDVAKIMDIGTGRDLFDDGSGEGDFNLTQSSDVLGTPEYMAPEQARDPRKADIRADIYGLGCALYHCLSGRPPFTHANTVRLLMMHASEPVRPVRELNSAVPDGLDQILGWMLAKDPAKRYQTPQRAAQALEVFLAADSRGVKDNVDAKKRAYLDWLAAQPEIDVELVTEPVEAAAPVEAPVAVAPPVAAPVARPVKPVPPAPGPAAPPRPPKPAKRQEAEPELDVEPAEDGSKKLIMILGIVIAVLVVLLAGVVGAVLLLWMRS